MISIYCITNIKTGKLYIGQTSQNLIKYFKDQWYKAKNPNNKNRKPALYAAIVKYGIKLFTIELLCECNTIDDANFCEIAFIAALKVQDRRYGYNIADGGGGRAGVAPWNKGIKLSKEFSEKCSIAQKKRFETEISNSKGKITSQETKDKIRETMKLRGICPSIEACIKGGQVSKVRSI